MRRHDKQITETSRIEAILKRATVCRLGLSDNNLPYVVPVCFGYHNNCLYVHSAPEGTKLDIIRRNPRVCFEADIDTQTLPAELACNWGMRYLSVIGFGTAAIINDHEEKLQALNIIMRQYSDMPEHHYAEHAISRIVIIRIAIESMTGKQSGYG